MHAKTVGQLAIEGAPRLDAHWRGDGAARCQKAEELFGLLTIVHHQHVSRAAHRLGIVVVGREEQHARSLELGMHDPAAHGLIVRGHAALAIAQHFHDMSEGALLVEGQRLLAACGEKQVVG